MIHWKGTFCCITLQIPWRSRSTYIPFKVTPSINLNKWKFVDVFINIASSPLIKKPKHNNMVITLWYYIKRLAHVCYLKQLFLLIWTNESLPPWEVILLLPSVLVNFSITIIHVGHGESVSASIYGDAVFGYLSCKQRSGGAIQTLLYFLYLTNHSNGAPCTKHDSK